MPRESERFGKITAKIGRIVVAIRVLEQIMLEQILLEEILDHAKGRMILSDSNACCEH